MLTPVQQAGKNLTGIVRDDKCLKLAQLPSNAWITRILQEVPRQFVMSFVEHDPTTGNVAQRSSLTTWSCGTVKAYNLTDAALRWNASSCSRLSGLESRNP